MSNLYLYHHGIKGQKWGVRRYQNEDGSLTPAGRARYYDSNGNFTTDRKLRREFYKNNKKRYSQMKRNQKRFIKDKNNEYWESEEGRKLERSGNSEKIAGKTMSLYDKSEREYAKDHINKIYDQKATSFMNAERKKRAKIAVGAVAGLTLVALANRRRIRWGIARRRSAVSPRNLRKWRKLQIGG